MPIRKETFVNDEIYHITARRLGDELLFIDDEDYYRCIFSFIEFNNSRAVEMRNRNSNRTGNGVRDSVEKEELVECLAFCLMPNHLHLLLRQVKDRGISKFMNKFGSGYARYFKEKHNIKQKGYFFQGRFNSVRIEDDRQLWAVFAYIHLNPVSIVKPLWKEKGIKNYKKIMEFLENYKWSSYLNYLGKKNFSLLTKRDFFVEFIGRPSECRKFIKNWLIYKSDKEIKKGI
jgi:putative transposase